MKHDNWSIYAISDADEPGDAVLTGMLHRDYDGVLFVAIPDEDGWLYADESEAPVRPLLLFYRGDQPNVEKVLAWVEEHGEEALCAVPGPAPNSYDPFAGGDEAIRSVSVSLHYPPYPWRHEARLGMEMGRYFNAVELVDWSDPTHGQPGSHTFRFYRTGDGSRYGMAVTGIGDDDLPN